MSGNSLTSVVFDTLDNILLLGKSVPVQVAVAVAVAVAILVVVPLESTYAGESLGTCWIQSVGIDLEA